MLKSLIKTKKHVAFGIMACMLVLMPILVGAVEGEGKHIHDQCCEHDLHEVPCEAKSPEDYRYAYEITEYFIVYTDRILDEKSIEEYRQIAMEHYANYEKMVNEGEKNSCTHPSSVIGPCTGGHRQEPGCSAAGCCYHIHCYRYMHCKTCGWIMGPYGYVFENAVNHSPAPPLYPVCSRCRI